MMVARWRIFLYRGRETCADMITIRRLQQLKPILHLTEIARRAQIPVSTLLAKVRRGTELSVTEARKIEDVLRSFGLQVLDESAENP